MAWAFVDDSLWRRIAVQREAAAMSNYRDPKLSDTAEFVDERSAHGTKVTNASALFGHVSNDDRSPAVKSSLGGADVDKEKYAKGPLPKALVEGQEFDGPSQPLRELPRTVAYGGAGCGGVKDIKWANPVEVWVNMMAKDELSGRQRKENYLSQHCGLSRKMRVILLDWLMEVSGVYTLHRETYYLAADIVDRYMTVTWDVMKTNLQLIGITALFIAAKVEEVTPPKLQDFVYVCDGACDLDAIVSMEMKMLTALKWQVGQVTVIGWLQLYLQLHHSHKLKVKKHKGFQSRTFSKLAMLADLCTLDQRSVKFRYSVVAASIFYHFANEELLTIATGYSLADIQECVTWMEPYYTESLTIGESFDYDNRNEEDRCYLQTFTRTLPDDLERVQAGRFPAAYEQYEVPVAVYQINSGSPAETGLGVLTPPMTGGNPLATKKVSADETAADGDDSDFRMSQSSEISSDDDAAHQAELFIVEEDGSFTAVDHGFEEE